MISKELEALLRKVVDPDNEFWTREHHEFKRIETAADLARLILAEIDAAKPKPRTVGNWVVWDFSVHPITREEAEIIANQSNESHRTARRFAAVYVTGTEGEGPEG